MTSSCELWSDWWQVITWTNTDLSSMGSLVVHHMAISLHYSQEISICVMIKNYDFHDYVIKWKHAPRYWPFMRGIHQWPVNSPHKGQWRKALMCSFIGPWINDWVNNREAGDLRLHPAHYDFIVIWNSSHIPGANECEQGRHTSPTDMPQQARWCLKAAAVVPRVLEHCP